jgi:phosphatidate phosphatase APP1
MTRFPKRHFVLVGDSGEKDPEIYARILSEFPERVEAIFIRDVTGEGQDAARYHELFPSGAKAKFRVFHHPEDLPRSLLSSGVQR